MLTIKEPLNNSKKQWGCHSGTGYRYSSAGSSQNSVKSVVYWMLVFTSMTARILNPSFIKHSMLIVALLIPPAMSAQTLPAGPIPLDCDRPCLEGLIDDYLAALVAHDPARLPLSADVSYSENEQMLEIGDGFWGTASGVGKYRHYYADPEAGQAGFMGSMLENGNLVLMALRLRVQLGR